MLVFIKFILKFNLLINFVLITGCASFEPKKNETAPEDNGSVFSKAQTLVAAHNYELALPFIKRSLEADNTHYFESLLLAARAYDQTAQPEQAILALQEYLKQNPVPKELIARSLLLKNQAKVKTDVNKSAEKRWIQKYIIGQNKKIVLEDLAWSLEFKCDQYCLEEISFLKEIQVPLISIVEQDTENSTTAANIIKNRYVFFNGYLHDDIQKSNYKKLIASKLYDSFRKLKNLDLENNHKNKSTPTKKLILSLGNIEKDLESGSL